MEIVYGDITKAKVDVIVNAANKSCLGGGGVDNAIQRAAGDELLMECIRLPVIDGVRCNTGQAVITRAGKLKAKYCIHTVGPIYGESLNPEQELMDCYINSIQLALNHQCTSIAFPAISTGVYRYPKNAAKEIAIKACEKFTDQIQIFLFYID